MIEKTLLVLAQPVVVLVVGRGKGRADGVELGVGGTAIVGQSGGAVFVVGHGLRPAGHLEQLFAVGRAEGDVRAGSGAVEVFPDVDFGLQRRVRGRMVALDGDDHARATGKRRLWSVWFAPARGVGSTDKTVSGRGQRGFALQAERDAQNVGRVGLEDDGLAFAVEFETLVRAWPRPIDGMRSIPAKDSTSNEYLFILNSKDHENGQIGMRDECK